MKALTVFIPMTAHFVACILIGLLMTALTDNEQWSFNAGGYAIGTSCIVGLAYWNAFVVMERPKGKRVWVFPPAAMIVLVHVFLIITAYTSANGGIDLRVIFFCLPGIPFALHVHHQTKRIMKRRRRETDQAFEGIE